MTVRDRRSLVSMLLGSVMGLTLAMTGNVCFMLVSDIVAQLNGSARNLDWAVGLVGLSYGLLAVAAIKAAVKFNAPLAKRVPAQ